MNKQELIKHFEEMEYVSIHQMGKKAFIDLIEQLDEPQPIKLKDVIARIKVFDSDTQKVWLNEILNELGSDYGTLKYKAGYEQGKFEGGLIPLGASTVEKPVVPQFVADWYEKNKEDFETNLFSVIYEIFKKHNDNELSELEEWVIKEYTDPFKTLVNMHQFGYEVEEEKRYYVRFKFIEDSYSYLTLIKHLNAWTLSSIKLDKKFRSEHTRKQLEEAGFGWVFDCPGIEIEEVQE